MIFSSTKVRCTGYQRVRQDRFGNKLIVAQVLWHAQFHMLQHGSIWTYMLNSICISIYFQPKSNLSYYRHKQEKIWPHQVRNQTAYEKSTKYFCEHMPYAYQPDSPQTKSISHGKSAQSSPFLHFSHIHTKSATLQRLESDSEANIEETLVIKTNSKWEKFPVLELKAWSDYIQIDPNRDFRGRIFDAFHNCAFSSFSAFR